MKTQVVHIDPELYEARELEVPARALAEGLLVAFPTETVYGIGVRADRPEAVARLLQARRSPKDKHLSIHLADQDHVFRHVHEVSPLAHRVMQRFWPGPLTIVLPAAAGEDVGLRLPDLRLARDLVRRAGGPVVAPSANLSGEAPATDAAGVLRCFEGLVDVVVDGGSTSHKLSSTVVRIHGRTWEVMREGSVKTSDLAALAYRHVLFVCTGNTCRSPMAQVICQSLLAERLRCDPAALAAKGYRISSAGTGAVGGAPAAAEAQAVATRLGMDLAKHASRPVTANLLADADDVYVMAHSHLRTLHEWMPEYRGKVRMFDAEEDIDDPLGGDEEAYERCARRLGRGMGAIVERMLK